MDRDVVYRRVFGSQIKLNDAHIRWLDDHFKSHVFSHRTLILEAGAIERYFYLVLSGVQALYMIDGKGEKIMLGFSYAGSVSGGYDSFVMRKPSTLFIEALSESEVIMINRSDFDALFATFPEFYEWRSHFIEAVLFGRISREKELVSSTAEERFLAFTSRCPPELLQIPQKYLASYLNMKPETYSRLRARRF